MILVVINVHAVHVGMRQLLKGVQLSQSVQAAEKVVITRIWEVMAEDLVVLETLAVLVVH